MASSLPVSESDETRFLISDLCDLLESYLEKDQVRQIYRAYLFGAEAHEGQRRISGEPYIYHPIAVARILAEMHMDAESIIAGILHDVIEDTGTPKEVVTSEFSEEVAELVDGVSKLTQIKFESQAEAQAENFRKMMLAMVKDIRVIIIKLADRLHNMRTLDAMRPDKRRRIAHETMDIYAPIANRLGIFKMRHELLDLSIKAAYPMRYRALESACKEVVGYRKEIFNTIEAAIRQRLKETNIIASVKYRQKNIHSIYRKMKEKKVSFKELTDVFGVRIMTQSADDCYRVLGVMHNLYKPLPGKFKDYLAIPKTNGYQSLHSSLFGPHGVAIEVQIRTEEMHQHAELGVAAHWRYKEGGAFDAGYEGKLAWLRQLLEWKDEEHSAHDFVDRFKSEAFQERVYVLTPQGRIIDLPQGATPLDFAYAVHTEVGHRCRGAKIDGRIVPLTRQLQNGEQIEVLTARQGEPSRDWLNAHLGYLKTSKARSRVRAWFKHQDYELNVSAGRTILDRELRRLGITGLPMEKMAGQFKYKLVDELLAAIGRGDILTGQLANTASELVPRSAPVQPEQKRTRKKRQVSSPGGIKILGVGNLLTTIARCCSPVPNDPIVGYITRGRGVSIHRQDCGNVLRLQGDDRDRLIEVEWGMPAEETYQVDVSVEAYDRSGLLSDITSVLANEKINLSGVNTATDKNDGIARMRLTLEISDIGQLSRVLTLIGQLPNVVEARRKV